MRIGFLAAGWQHTNGWAHYSTSLIQALERQGITTQIITARNSPLLSDQTLYPLLPSIAPPDNMALGRMAWWLPHIRRLLADCDIIHATVEQYAPLAALVARERPRFLTIHGSYIHLPRIRPWPVSALYDWAFRQATLICVSHYTERIAQTVVPGARTMVINNGVDVERFAILPTLPDPPQRPTVLTSGGVKARKGTLPLVKAMVVVREAVPNVQCIIIGKSGTEPHYAEQVQQAIHDLNLSDCVHLLGFVDEATLLGWYAAADVFVLPSINDGWRFEGFGLVNLEASAAGLPVIGSTDCGVEDAIVHGETGLLVHQSALETELPRAIIDLLTHPERAQAMGAAGKRHAALQTWDAVAQQMIAVYEKALSSA